MYMLSIVEACDRNAVATPRCANARRSVFCKTSIRRMRALDGSWRVLGWFSDFLV